MGGIGEKKDSSAGGEIPVRGKTIASINDRIKKGEAVVLTAEELKVMAKTKSPAEILAEVDVVTTGTFGPMCSSGAFVNFGHYDPPIRMEEISLNDVPVYAGLAAVDSYIGATSESPFHPAYGGAHVIEDRIAGNSVKRKARAKGTDCYPTKEVQTVIDKEGLNEFYLFNPRNAYQNYTVAVNSQKHAIYTYMGTLMPQMENATYSTSGELSPLLNDPYLRTIGIGTRIFLGGTQGFVAWQGTQFNTTKPRNEAGVPTSNAATLALIGDAKEMSTDFIRAAYFERYGVTMFVGVGVPIPLPDEDMVRAVSITNSQITTTVADYGLPDKPAVCQVTYEELRSGTITIRGKEVKTGPLSSLDKAREIAGILKRWILDGEFALTEPVQMLPQHSTVKGLKQRS